jgi:hypothetical protein
LRAYNVSEETYRHEFRTLQKSPEESYEDLGGRLANLAQKWLNPTQRLRHDKDYQHVSEKIVIKQFIHQVINPRLRDRLREVKPRTLANISQAADEYVAYDKMDRESNFTKGTSVTSGYNQRGGGYARFQKASAHRRPVFTCYNCHEEGHKAADCPNQFRKYQTEPYSNLNRRKMKI